jgi:hypothetical protein
VQGCPEKLIATRSRDIRPVIVDVMETSTSVAKLNPARSFQIPIIKEGRKNEDISLMIIVDFGEFIASVHCRFVCWKNTSSGQKIPPPEAGT